MKIKLVLFFAVISFQSIQAMDLWNQLKQIRIQSQKLKQSIENNPVQIVSKHEMVFEMPIVISVIKEREALLEQGRQIENAIYLSEKSNYFGTPIFEDDADIVGRLKRAAEDLEKQGQEQLLFNKNYADVTIDRSKYLFAAVYGGRRILSDKKDEMN